MSQPPAHSTYDDLPYPSNPFPQTRPDHLASIATLFDLVPPPTESCRLLELGCASGGNLIPMALASPGAHFVGVEFSEKQVQEARKTIAALGLKNIDIRHANILDVDETYGEFEYVISHGVYSWVPEVVQDKILGVIRDHMSDDGVGYVSYNTFPGWHMRGQIRDMMCYHVSRHRELPPLGRVAQARGLLDFLARSVADEKNVYGMLLKKEAETLQKHSDAYLFHEHLEENNDPVYFFEFSERLHAKKLRYLGEADFCMMIHANQPPEVQQVLDQIAPNLIQMEQYLDFLHNRAFRQSLIVHEHHRPNYTLHPDKIAAFHLASPLKPKAAKPDLLSTAGEEFVGLHEMKLTSTDPIVKAAIVCLAEAWPRAVSFHDLLTQAQKRLDAAARALPAGAPTNRATAEEERFVLAKAILTAYAGGSNNLVELWLRPPSFAATVSDRPLASPLARLQAAAGPTVSSLRHQAVTLGEFDRQLLPYLDGTRTRSGMLKVLLEHFRRGKLTLARNGAPIVEEHRARPVLAETLDMQLPNLARAALLVA
jgi:methyltransferase-like protein/cyclopropane fatty-acyl-phospholipid synthase-like methyltransferase